MFEKALTTDSITNRIYTLRRVQVMLDEDLAMMYGVETKVLNQAVKRNQGRFPEEFCFHLEDAELEILKSQLAVSSGSPLRSQPVTLKSGRGQHRKYRPYAFT